MISCIDPGLKKYWGAEVLYMMITDYSIWEEERYRNKEQYKNKPFINSNVIYLFLEWLI